jgi:23S rRNA (uridine2552-2'-O)-methyltransferase
MVNRKNPYVGDARTRRAKLEGYPARSVYKLEEIDQRCRLLRQGQRVLDLGAAPGSWSLYAATRVGAHGLVVAIDIKPMEQIFPPQVIALQADAFESSQADWLRYAPFDLVLSDMAPSTSGSKIRDQALSQELFLRGLEIAKRLSKPKSTFLGKLFMSGEFNETKSLVARCYEQVKVLRPEGIRQNSSEVYVLGLGRSSADSKHDG